MKKRKEQMKAGLGVWQRGQTLALLRGAGAGQWRELEHTRQMPTCSKDCPPHSPSHRHTDCTQHKRKTALGSVQVREVWKEGNWPQKMSSNVGTARQHEQ